MYDAETLAKMREERIERLRADIRMVVVGYADIISEPFPYVIKKNLPLMRESRSRILIADSDIPAEAI